MMNNFQRVQLFYLKNWMKSILEHFAFTLAYDLETFKLPLKFNSSLLPLTNRIFLVNTSNIERMGNNI